MEELKRKTQADIPAPPTLIFIQETKVDMAILKTKIDNVCKQLVDNSEEHKIILKKIDDFIDTADNKYADREQFIFWRYVLVSGILIAILLGVIKLIIK
jgi:hypothetical protein